MTVAIAAIAPTADSQIVTVSDAMISFGNVIPASDEAVMKNHSIARNWGTMFAAMDTTAYQPVLEKLLALLHPTGVTSEQIRKAEFTEEQVREAAQAAYEKEFDYRFFTKHLARFGYADIGEFRRDGFTQMGKELYHDYSYQLARHELGLELLVYGFSPAGRPHIFTVTDPGEVRSFGLLRYAAIGSGANMALAALARKKFAPGLEETIYRLLDAKFSSETATGVGKKTHVITRSKDGKHGMMRPAQIDAVREEWGKHVNQPEPKSALDLIRETNAFKAVMSE